MTAAVEAIWKELHERLLRYIRRRVTSADDADDILQEVFLRIHEHLPELRSAEKLRAWVLRITSNAIRDHYRSRNRRELRRGTDGGLLSDALAEGDQEASASDELARSLRPLLEGIREPYREAVQRVDLDGWPQRQAAERLGLSISGLKSRVQRGRQQLKRALLHCCHIELDRRGTVIDYEARQRCEAECCPKPSDH